jgi:hypothetical protein
MTSNITKSGKMSKALGRAARATIETKAADVLEQQHSLLTVSMVSHYSLQTHKRLDGGTLCPIVLRHSDGAGAADGALSDRNLKAALVQMRRQVDDKGILIQTQP